MLHTVEADIEDRKMFDKVFKDNLRSDLHNHLGMATHSGDKKATRLAMQIALDCKRLEDKFRHRSVVCFITGLIVGAILL